LNGEQIRSGFRIYTPIVTMAFIIIAFRIIFIPNTLVNILFPPLLVVFTFWQWSVIKRKVGVLPRSDMFYAWISLLVITVSSVMAWGGFVLMAVQLFIWWLFQLTAIQTITCCFHLLDEYEKKHILSKMSEAAKPGDMINVTWFYDLVRMSLVPIAGAMSVIWCIWLSADVFDLKETCAFIFMTPFVDVPNVCQLSLFKLVLVAELFFVFRYVSYLLKAVYKYYRLRSINEKILSSTDDDEEEDEMSEDERAKYLAERRAKRAEIARNSNFTLFNNVTAIIVWGFYFVFALVLLQVPQKGISIVTAGLATGVGFAMKDILNNFFYGIQLMAGRVRVGDFIECDGILGKVDTITYQSTQIVTPDGCVIAFLNSTLFSKNFKNLTRNHQYELVKIPVGVAYGTDVERVRALLLSELHELAESKNMAGRHIVDPKRPLGVAFSNFGDSSVDLLITMWIRVEDKVAFVARVKEMVYKVFNKNNIEIPFPQQDIYIRKVVEAGK
ncbi:MAG: mechanosensitive ion channel family protein, partial [Bacteroidaceae bacterium]|nr:mechanosensitive ion channel family protein [Bacteroidaceae bacterium]